MGYWIVVSKAGAPIAAREVPLHLTDAEVGAWWAELKAEYPEPEHTTRCTWAPPA